MNSPGITRGRRPFLAPIWFAGLTVLLAAAVLFGVVRWSIDRAGETTTFILLPPAETQEHAERLAELLSATRPATLWVPDGARAEQTLAPLAERLDLVPEPYDATSIERVLQRVGRDYLGETLVLIGDPEQLPLLVKRLTRGKHVIDWEGGQHGRLWIVTVTRFGPPSVTELRY